MDVPTPASLGVALRISTEVLRTEELAGGLLTGLAPVGLRIGAALVGALGGLDVTMGVLVVSGSGGTPLWLGLGGGPSDVTTISSLGAPLTSGDVTGVGRLRMRPRPVF